MIMKIKNSKSEPKHEQKKGLFVCTECIEKLLHRSIIRIVGVDLYELRRKNSDVDKSLMLLRFELLR